MIKKLPKFDKTEASIYHVERLYAKVNELVDAVNGILDYAPLEMDMKAVEDFAESHQDRLNDCKRIGNLNEELIRTRKALDVAVDTLKRIDETRSGVKENLHATNGRILNAGNGFCWTTIDDIHNALEQITALEQKDVK